MIRLNFLSIIFYVKPHFAFCTLRKWLKKYKILKPLHRVFGLDFGK